MPRLRFYTGTWSGPPASGDCYEVPINPQEFLPMDSSGYETHDGIMYTALAIREYDNRQQTLVWNDLYANDTYND